MSKSICSEQFRRYNKNNCWRFHVYDWKNVCVCVWQWLTCSCYAFSTFHLKFITCQIHTHVHTQKYVCRIFIFKWFDFHGARSFVRPRAPIECHTFCRVSQATSQKYYSDEGEILAIDQVLHAFHLHPSRTFVKS